MLVSTILTGIKFRFTLFSGLLSIAAIHSLSSAILSNYNSIALTHWVEFLKIIVISYLITMLIRSEKDLKMALIVISLSMGLEGAKQGWIRLITSPGSINENSHEMLGDNNGVAVGMLMVVPILLALYQTIERKIIKYGFLFLVIGVIYRALSTYSRGGFLTFLTMCIIFWLRSEHKTRTLITIVLIAVLLLPTLPQSFWDRMDTMTNTDGEERESSAASRIYYWELAFEMAKNNPLFGVGHNVYQQEYDAYDYTGGRWGNRRVVHSAWFGILSEWGFPGIILFMGIYIYSLYLCIQASRKCKKKPEYKSLRIYSNSILTTLIAASVGISFLSFQYLEMLWHFFALAVVSNQVLNTQIANEDNTANGINGNAYEFVHLYDNGIAKG